MDKNKAKRTKSNINLCDNTTEEDEHKFDYSTPYLDGMFDRIRISFNENEKIVENLKKVLWLVVSILGSLRIVIEDGVVLVDISIYKVIFVNCTTLMLLSGLKNNKIEFLLPWLIFSTWNIFAKKFFALEFLFCTHYYRMFGLPAIVVGLFTFGLKFYLWAKIVYFVLKDK